MKKTDKTKDELKELLKQLTEKVDFYYLEAKFGDKDKKEYNRGKSEGITYCILSIQKMLESRV